MYWSLCLYFAAFILNLLALIVTRYFYDFGPAYAWVYSLTSIPIFLAIAGICWQSLLTREHRARAIALGFILALTHGHLAHVGIVRAVTVYDWITLTEGTLLTWAGTVLSFSAAYVKRKGLAMTLATLWLVQSLFSFGYILHFDWQIWQEMNWWLPETICIVAFTVIAWLLRRPSERMASRPGPLSSIRLALRTLR